MEYWLRKRAFILRRAGGLKIAAGLITAGSAVAIYRSIDEWEDVREVGIVRFGRAVVTVAKIVADYKYHLYGLYYPSEVYDSAIKQCHSRSAERLLELAKANGGVFIKVGQHLAAMEYLIPQEYTQTLSVLTSRAPQKPYEEIQNVIETDLGKPINETFSEFSEAPIGAASLAQVHLAKIRGSNELVAVKVQHRRVYKNSKTDMHTMEILAIIAAKLFPEFRLMWLVDETKRNLPKELDFLNEAENAKKVSQQLRHLRFLKIPRIYDDLTTKRVLTMEYCPGAQIDDAQYMRDNKIDTHDVCRKIARMISEMIFLKGYLHADPHPGNVLVNKQKNGQIDIILLDHGLYLTMDEKFQRLYSELWLALLKPDLDKIKMVANEMGVGDLYGLFACIVTRRSWKSVTQGIDKSKMDSSERQELRNYAASLIPQISEVLHRVPREMLLILKTNDLMRNIEHKLSSYRNDTLIEMSRCVIRAHYTYAISHSSSHFSALSNRCAMWWALFKLRLYELALIAMDKWPIRRNRISPIERPLADNVNSAAIF
ncbi:hypothetical protein WR25_14415 [Diploscapter pachys]|uniref:Protein kinase domain-containing protein n=1 Tax=Diploscapter pachys TaxID=2018661 RepID=A0A2A2JG71_9BILA|nr:hypothetical protein WR25_14415 [Diploscapter pachys]